MTYRDTPAGHLDASGRAYVIDFRPLGMPSALVVGSAAGVAASGLLPGVAAAGSSSLDVGAGGLLLGAGVTAIGLLTRSRVGTIGAALGAGLAIDGVRTLINSGGSVGSLVPAAPIVDPGPGPGIDHNPAAKRLTQDLAVGWWPEDMRLDTQGGTQQLRFEAIVANLGIRATSVDGARLRYDVYRRNDDGTLSDHVGGGSAAIDQLDVVPFPPPFSEANGHPSRSYGRVLTHVTELQGQQSGVINADHASQAIDLGDAGNGTYVLRERIERPSPIVDEVTSDDVRDTTFTLQGGTVLQTSSSYPGV